MQSAIEKLDGLTRHLIITIPADEVDSVYQQHLNKVAKKVKVDGFRAGKVPLNVVESRFGGDLRREVASELMEKNFPKAIDELDLKMASRPELVAEQAPAVEKGNAFEFTIAFEAYPEIEIQDLSGVTVERFSVDVTEADIDKIVERQREEHVDWDAVDRPAELKDRVDTKIIRVDLPEGEDSEPQEQVLILGENTFLPDFDQHLVGLKAGDSKTVDMPVPSSFAQAEGKADDTWKLQVEITVVEAPKALTDEELVSRINRDGVTTIEALREDIRTSLADHIEQLTKSKLQKQITDALLKLHPVTVPEGLINDQIASMQREQQQRLAQMFGDPELVKKLPLPPREEFEPQAREHVHTGLVLSEVIRLNEIKLDDEKLAKHIERVASHQDDPEHVTNLINQNADVLSQIQGQVLEEQVFDWLLTQIQVTDKTISYDELAALDEKSDPAAE